MYNGGLNNVCVEYELEIGDNIYYTRFFHLAHAQNKYFYVMSALQFASFIRVLGTTR